MGNSGNNVFYECPHLASCLKAGRQKLCKDCHGLNRSGVIRHTGNKSLHSNCTPDCPVHSGKSRLWCLPVVFDNYSCLLTILCSRRSSILPLLSQGVWSYQPIPRRCEPGLRNVTKTALAPFDHCLPLQIPNPNAATRPLQARKRNST